MIVKLVFLVWNLYYITITNLQKNALGHTERSSHIYNKVADNLLGALNVKDIHTGVEFSIGSGFTEEQRRNME